MQPSANTHEEYLERKAKFIAQQEALKAQRAEKAPRPWDVSQPSRGLGDTVTKFTTVTGIAKVVGVISKVTGVPCGCHGDDGRQGDLNKLVPYETK